MDVINFIWLSILFVLAVIISVVAYLRSTNARFVEMASAFSPAIPNNTVQLTPASSPKNQDKLALEVVKAFSAAYNSNSKDEQALLYEAAFELLLEFNVRHPHVLD